MQNYLCRIFNDLRNDEDYVDFTDQELMELASDSLESYGELFCYGDMATW